MISLEDISDDPNGDVLRRLRSHGDSLEIAREIDFSVIFASRRGADAFCNRLRKDADLRTECKRRENDEFPWDVTVVRNMVPDHGAIGAMEAFLEAIAEPLGGRNDGWGCFTMTDLETPSG